MEMMFGGDKERISKPSSSPDEIISAVAVELDNSHSDKSEVSLPHELPIGSNFVEPKGATTKKGDIIGLSESKKLPIIKEQVVSPKSEISKQPSTLTELIEKLQNPLASTAETWWLKDLLNLRKDYENSGSEASLYKLNSRETLLVSYLQFKSKLLSSPDFIMKCETFDSNAELRDRDKLREVVALTGGGGCVSIQGSVGINRSPWYRLVGTQAYGLDVWYAGSLLAPISLLSVESLLEGSTGVSYKSENNVFAMADRPGKPIG